MSAEIEVTAEFPPKLQCLFKPSRYKILYGGRGGAKSWGIARALLIKGYEEVHKVGCFREFQNSIEDSVHALLANQIEELGFSGFYDVQKTSIVGNNGTQFYFRGLKRNIGGIMSIEGTTIAWVEEAKNVSKSSWEKLIPTIRNLSSEIWISFNPELDTDETYKQFVLNPPDDAIVVKLNWSDNPWFAQTELPKEKDQMQRRDPDAYLNVWEGNCRHTLDGAVYANELRAAMEGGRICRVPYDQSKPVHTAWDLGRADMTSIWFFQIAGLGELRVIDFFEDNQKSLPYYLKKLQEKPYVYGTDYMPHDADSEHLAADKSIAGQARGANRTVRVLDRQRVALGINVVRTLFPNIWIDAEKCADGLQSLRHYRYEVDEDTGQFDPEPLHDDASHAADAFRYMCIAFREPKKIVKKRIEARPTSWMAA